MLDSRHRTSSVWTETTFFSYLKLSNKAGLEDAHGHEITEGGWMKDDLLLAIILEAGSDTTASTLQSFMLLMLSCPHILTKTRVEIDAVVGAERMPTPNGELLRRCPSIIG